MSGAIPFVLGLGLLIIVLVDLCWTLLWVTGSSGPLSGRLMALGWRAVRSVAGGHHQVLSLYGPVALIATMVLWAVAIWSGWTLVFSADPTSVLTSDGIVRSDLASRLYLAGSAVFTMGIGDLRPAADWRIMAVLANASGLLFLSLVVSYLLSIVGAVVSQRAYAGSISSIAGDADGIARAVAEAGSASGFEQLLAGLTKDLARATEQHAAYVALRFFHPARGDRSAPRMAVALYDAILMLGASRDPALRPDGVLAASTLTAITTHLGSLARDPDGARAAPRRPEPEPRIAGLLTIDDDRLATRFDEHARPRARMAEVLDELGWTWPSPRTEQGRDD